MMKENDTTRKQMIRKVMGIFLAAMIILTFFSNTIMNYSLPEVATEVVSSGSVSSKIRGSGVVEANNDYEVKATGTRVIKEVKVKIGDTVEKNEVLFTFEEGENTELEEAQETLDSMEMDYAKSLLKIAPDYVTDNKEIKAAQEELNNAIVAQKEASNNATKLKNAKKTEAVAKKNVNDQQKKVDNAQTKIDAINDAGDVNSLEAQVTSSTRELDNMKTALADLKEDLKNAQTAGDTDLVTALNRQIRDLEKDIQNKETDLTNEKKALANAKTVSTNLVSLQSELAKESKQLTAYQAVLANATTKVQELEALPTVAEAKILVKEKQEMLENLLLALTNRKKQDSISEQIENMDLQVARERIEKQRELVEKLKNSNDLTEIRAKDVGTVSMINCEIGDTIPAETPMAIIQLSESGYMVNITVTKDQGKLVKVGNEAKIENLWGKEASAVLESIKVDTEKPNQNLVLTFEVKGDVNIGETLSFSVGESSQRYDAVVPNSAIREDNDGKFVLVVNVKSSPLGNRYKLTKASIDVLASGDSYSGVSGALYEYSNVVTNSTKPLEAGMQVRLAN